METRDGRFVLTYNGEIYNFKELKIELIREGTSISLKGDSEVLLHAFAEWGVDALLALQRNVRFCNLGQQGKTADCRPRSVWSEAGLLLPRSTAFLFASEHKAFRAFPGYRVPLRRRGARGIPLISEFLYGSHVVRGVKLLAGWLLSSNFELGIRLRIEPNCYWDFHFEEPEGNRSTRLTRSMSLTVSFARQLIGNWSATSMSDPTCLEESIPARSPHLAAAQFRSCGRLLSALISIRHLASNFGYDERSEGRIHVLPIQDRTLRDGPEGR